VKKRLTRRKFLEAGIQGSIAMTGAARAGLGAVAARARVVRGETPSSVGLDSRDRDVLRAAADEIIPANEGMPAASEVGAAEYLDRLAREDSGLKRQLARSLSSLEELSRRAFKKSFSELSRDDRVSVLKDLEGQPASDSFALLRDFVYEAYYTQPKVWKLIGYELYPTNQSGPAMKPFDQTVLAHVRKRPKLYREAT
jgi:gluconate 2-dehydrogenase subunit 3-like protein